MKSFYYDTNNLNPYLNLATEDYFVNYVSTNQDTIILYFWRNDNTVVIGRHQDAQAECNQELMQKDKVYLARRKTGGGAVYHDVNNLNFSFIVPKHIFNKQKSMEIIKNALLNLDINAEISGRNDILVNNKKISGNAYFYNHNTALHHGTILINTDFFKMQKYLTVDKDKLKNNGVKSVKSRVININELNPLINIAKIKSALKQSFENNYNLKCKKYVITTENETTIKKISSNYTDEKYILGKFIHWHKESKKRFNWGNCTVKTARISDNKYIYKIFSDSIDIDFIDKSEQFLNNKISKNTFTEHQLLMLDDIITMLKENK